MMADRQNRSLLLAWGSVGGVLAMVLALIATLIPGRFTDPDGLENGTIVILTGRDDSVGKQRHQLVNQWNSLYPKSPAQILELTSLADAQRSEMLARAQSGRGEIDVFNLDVTWTAEFAEAGYIRPLDESEISTSGFLEAPLGTCRYQHRLWALPFNTDVGLLYYRSDLLGLLGEQQPPDSWAKLKDQVNAIRARTGNAVEGYVGQFADYEGLTVNAMEVVRGMGGAITDDDGDVVVEDHWPAIRDAVDLLEAIAPDGAPELDEDESIQRFRSGQTLFMRNWPRAYRSLTQDLEGAPAVPFGVTELPNGFGVLGGQNLAVSADSTRPRAAQALIEFLTSERSQQILFERGGLPATREVVYHDQAVQEYPYEAILRALKSPNATLRPTEPHYARFSEVLRTVVNDALRQGSSLPDADDLQEQLEDALKGRLAPVDSG
jgi:multiple sugar transport system substrate-binding protein